MGKTWANLKANRYNPDKRERDVDWIRDELWVVVYVLRNKKCIWRVRPRSGGRTGDLLTEGKDTDTGLRWWPWARGGSDVVVSTWWGAPTWWLALSLSKQKWHHTQGGHTFGILNRKGNVGEVMEIEKKLTRETRGGWQAGLRAPVRRWSQVHIQTNCFGKACCSDVGPGKMPVWFQPWWWLG